MTKPLWESWQSGPSRTPGACFTTFYGQILTVIFLGNVHKLQPNGSNYREKVYWNSHQRETTGSNPVIGI